MIGFILLCALTAAAIDVTFVFNLFNLPYLMCA